MGVKILNKTIKETYKSKRRAATDEEKIVIPNAHPAIVDEETWNLVQRLRKTKRKPERITGAPNPLTGILYCADCGHKMYHKQGMTGRINKPHNEYVCASYRHYSRSCTCHYIRVEVVEKLILTAIRRVSGYVRKNESEFIERVRQESVIQQETAAKESRRKLGKHKRRHEEIKGLIKKLYESYAADKIPENHFADLLKGYDEEQATLEGEMERLQSEVDAFNTDSVRADKFIELVKRHTEFTELSAQLLNEFIEKVVVHEAVKVEGKRTMEVDIHLNFIGRFEAPALAGEEVPPVQTRVRNSHKKLRRFMTDEEVARAREYDRRRNAKKKAERIAAEQAERAAILQGTSYEEQALKNEIDKIAS